MPRKGRIRQSASRWCYKQIPLEELCVKGAQMGLKAIDLLNEDEWEVPGPLRIDLQHGLRRRRGNYQRHEPPRESREN